MSLAVAGSVSSHVLLYVNKNILQHSPRLIKQFHSLEKV